MLALWKLRVLDPSARPSQASDLFKEHIPTVVAGFGAWREGRLALWNPDQLAGLPFMAVPYAGLLYPGNLAYVLIPDAGLATEVTEIAHFVFGGGCMLWLVRSLGMGWGAAIAAGLTMVGSGWINCATPMAMGR